MTDSPQLPDSPMSVATPSPRHAAWHRKLLWVSGTLIALGSISFAVGAGALALTLAGIWHLRNAIGLAAMGVAATPLTVTGLSALRVAHSDRPPFGGPSGAL